MAAPAPTPTPAASDEPSRPVTFKIINRGLEVAKPVSVNYGGELRGEHGAVGVGHETLSATQSYVVVSIGHPDGDDLIVTFGPAALQAFVEMLLANAQGAMHGAKAARTLQ